MGKQRNRTLLITGATGFVGSHVAKYLADAGWKVYAVVRPTSDPSILQGSAKQIIIIRHNNGLPELKDIVNQIQPITVIHIASLVTSEHSPQDVDALIDSNLRFGLHLLECMRLQGCHRLINTGTSWQHFHNALYNPVNLYAATKQAFEDLVEYYIQPHDFSVITLKLFDTYGPDDNRQKLFNLLHKAAQECTQLSMTPGEQLIDLVHIDDVVRAYETALARIVELPSGIHERYAVSSSHPIPLKKAVAEYQRITGRKFNIQWGARPYRTREVMAPWNNGALLPGWKASITLEKGLRELWEYQQKASA